MHVLEDELKEQVNGKTGLLERHWRPWMRQYDRHVEMFGSHFKIASRLSVAQGFSPAIANVTGSPKGLRHRCALDRLQPYRCATDQAFRA
jgi:hypothetical protein